MVKLGKICHISLLTKSKGNGNPMIFDEAKKQIEDLNKKSPNIKHFVEVIDNPTDNDYKSAKKIAELEKDGINDIIKLINNEPDIIKKANINNNLSYWDIRKNLVELYIKMINEKLK